MHRVDEGDDRSEAQTVIEHRIRTEREEDRGRVGEPGRLDHDPAKPPNFAGIAPLEQAAQGSRQILAHGAAQTTPRQLDHTALNKVDEVMIDRNLADFVDDDGGIGEFWRDQCPSQ